MSKNSQIMSLFKLLKPVFQDGVEKYSTKKDTKTNRPLTSKVNDEKANNLYNLIMNN